MASSAMADVSELSGANGYVATYCDFSFFADSPNSRGARVVSKRLTMAPVACRYSPLSE